MFFLVILLFLLPSFIFSIPLRREASICSPFHTNFAEGTIASSPSDIHTSAPPKPFVALNGSTYIEDRYGGPLSLFLDKPRNVKATKDEEGIKVNNVVAEGATINSTFSLLYGRVSFTIAAPTVEGVVTAVILISETSTHDEIDVEILGVDPHHFQTNVFVAPPTGKEPLYGVYSGRHEIDGDPIDEYHVYTIDWSEKRIIWSVDDSPVRTLKREDARGNYPSHASRIQIGIWDGSSPGGTAQWSGGPINWTQRGQATAKVRSVTVECD